MSRIFSTVLSDGSRVLINLNKVSRVVINKSAPKALTFVMAHEKNIFIGSFLWFGGAGTKDYTIMYTTETEAVAKYDEIKEQMK